MARSRWLEFKDLGTMYRFILLYRDLFVPYSEDTISCESFVSTKTVWNKGKSRPHSEGYHNENVIKMMREGYRICGNMIKVHMERSEWNQVESLFRKEKVRRNIYKYVFE